MDKYTKQWMDVKLSKTKEALIRNNMDARIVESKEDVLKVLQDIIEEDSVVSVGGSQSLFECGVIDKLRKMNIQYEDRYAANLTREQMEEIYRSAFQCDYYLASSNAVTMNGELFNVDGTGNRVAAMTYGPKHVILVVGQNKIVADLQEAKKRVENIAAPANNLRLNKSNACTFSGKCIDCKSETRICATYVTHAHQMKKNRFIILLVKEDVGY